MSIRLLILYTSSIVVGVSVETGAATVADVVAAAAADVTACAAVTAAAAAADVTACAAVTADDVDDAVTEIDDATGGAAVTAFAASPTNAIGDNWMLLLGDVKQLFSTSVSSGTKTLAGQFVPLLLLAISCEFMYIHVYQS